MAEVVNEVGRDATRFMMLYRKNDAVLDFDLAKVIEQSRDNPVFYVQYGHARAQSVFRNARALMPELPSEAAARAEMLGSRRPRAARRRGRACPDAAARALSAVARRRPLWPMSRTVLPSIYMILLANFTRSGIEEMMRHIYASLSRMIHK